MLEAQADGRPGEHAHRERERVVGCGAGALEDAFAEERGESRVQGCIARGAQELRGEEEEALGGLVVARAVEVGAVLEHAEDPFEGGSDLVSAPAGVEEAQDVERYDGIRAWTLGVKVGLP